LPGDSGRKHQGLELVRNKDQILPKGALHELSRRLSDGHRKGDLRSLRGAERAERILAEEGNTKNSSTTGDQKGRRRKKRSNCPKGGEIKSIHFHATLSSPCSLTCPRKCGEGLVRTGKSKQVTRQKEPVRESQPDNLEYGPWRGEPR